MRLGNPAKEFAQGVDPPFSHFLGIAHKDAVAVQARPFSVRSTQGDIEFGEVQVLCGSGGIE